MGYSEENPEAGCAQLVCLLLLMECKALLGAVSLFYHWGVGECYPKAGNARCQLLLEKSGWSQSSTDGSSVLINLLIGNLIREK